jgi:Tol biopolymer transport system component
MLAWNPDTDKGIWFPSVSNKGTIFFGAYLDSIGNYGKSDLYMYSSGKITNLGDVINSPGEEWDPYISPDESYLLFESDRPGGYGNTDIYISFKTKEGWGKPINLGSTINTNAYEVAARVSPDGRYIFFDRPFKKEQDIHWMKATVIERLKKKQVR